MKIVILGGGPCGLGAAWRLNELGHKGWLLFEASDHWGGLATSFRDREGFLWDLGGHVLFSHYPYFDQVMDELLGKKDGWLFHKREAWIKMQGRFIPYPLQQNIHYLSKEVFWECLEGIIDIQSDGSKARPAHFGEWMEKTFGKGLVKWFLRPYNFKVWGYPPEEMDWTWIGERVAPVDLKKILKNAIFQQDDVAWGPNAQFRFPKFGGTGAIWSQLAKSLPADRVFLNRKARKLDRKKHTVLFDDGSVEQYDALLSTIPLTTLGEITTVPFFGLGDDYLKYSSTHIVGMGLRGGPPEELAEKCWIYFPEDNCPFYRATVFSNYSPNNVPDISRQWSLMFEVSETTYKPVNNDTIVADVIEAAVNSGLISSRKMIGHVWNHRLSKGYPLPARMRNDYLLSLLLELEKMDIYSRGRFGGWRYEVGNMDHSFMQGVECINKLLRSDEEVTLWYPEVVNSP